jgi:hypothetical protein
MFDLMASRCCLQPEEGLHQPLIMALPAKLMSRLATNCDISLSYRMTDASNMDRETT